MNNYTTEKRRKRIIFSLCLSASCVLILSGCNRGLSPTQASASVQMGFGGTIHFVSAWPPADSLYNLKVVAFRTYPPKNIITEITSGGAEVYPPALTSLPDSVDSVSYSFKLDSAAVFRYVAVALQYGSSIYQDWKVVGAYGYSHGVGQPDSVIVPSGSFINGIDINVDFKNTPPTPFVGAASSALRN